MTLGEEEAPAHKASFHAPGRSRHLRAVPGLRSIADARPGIREKVVPLAYARPDEHGGYLQRASYWRYTGPATGVVIGGCRVLAGASSWADRSLVRDGGFYPSRSLSAAQRLAYYTSRLPLAEIATTYRFPPTPELAKRWAATTPAGFTLDVRAWSLLCGAPTWPESLWPDLQGHVKPSRRDATKLYRQRLPASVVDECWARFNHALRPLADAGRLGVVIVRFPTWFSPRPAAWKELAELPSRLPGLRVAVELSNERWFEGTACEQTLGVLEEIGLVVRLPPQLDAGEAGHRCDRRYRLGPLPGPPASPGEPGRCPKRDSRRQVDLVGPASPLQRGRTGSLGTGRA